MIGVIADDLTGAAELGAVGLRYGLSAEVVCHGRPSGRTDLICVDTDSRSCGPAQAARRAASAARMLQAAGAKWIYKKVDSVLRGQVTPEVEAVMRALEFDRALLLPVNPSLGRIIQGGNYFLRGKLIHKTEFARDPEYPRRSANVMKLLVMPKSFALRVATDGKVFPERTILIGEAGSSRDVRGWAEFCDDTMLPVGGAEFFNALMARKISRRVKGEKFTEPAGGRLLFISGTSSRSGRALLQMEKRRGTPVFSLPRELAMGARFTTVAAKAIAKQVVAAFEEKPRVILAVGLPIVRDVVIARELSKNLVRVAEQVMRRVPVTQVYAEGGATAAELVRRMSWPRLTVRRELAPGVVTLAVVDGVSPLLLTIKPGSYAWPAEWTAEPIVC